MEEKQSHGIQSIEVGVKILKMVAEAEKSITITELVELCQTSKSKLHRYLTSFVRTEMLEKSEDSKYILGRETLRLGLKASHDLKIVDIANSHLIYLKELFNQTTALAVWGDNGPFFVSWIEGTGPINIGVKVGSKVSATDSAVGRIFANYLPGDMTSMLIAKELEESGISFKEFSSSLSSISLYGFTSVNGTIIPGISAVATPIFNHNNSVIAALCIVGLPHTVDTSAESSMVKELKKRSALISETIGWKL